MTAESRFGRYQLVEPIGQGDAGQVYRAVDTTTDRVVALKVLPADDAYGQRFRAEARIAASLTDPHVVPIHGYGEIDGRLYLDMRLIDGRDLGAVLEDGGGRLQPKTAVSYIEQVAEALDVAHSAGLVHRAVKLSNILVTERDFVYLVFAGSPATDEERNDPASDIHALAGVLHECLTGKSPSDATAGIPPAFAPVFDKALAPDHSARFDSAGAFATAARTALHTRISAPSPAPPTALKKPVRQKLSRPRVGGFTEWAHGVRWVRVAVVVALVLAALGSARFVYVATYLPDQQIDAAASAAAKKGAEDGTVAVLSYSPAHLSDDIANAKSHLTGDFLKYYTQFTDQIFAAAARQQQVTTTATVERAAVSELHADSAVVLLFVNKATSSKANPVPAGKPATVRATMKKVDGSWLIEKFDPL